MSAEVSPAENLEGHVCEETDGEWVVCIEGAIYGPCEFGEDSDDDGICDGACRFFYLCECPCHSVPLS